MKAKLYAISLIAGLGFAFSANAQCTITSMSVTPSGLMVNATMTGSGATLPGYGWDWGDVTAPATSQNASHTYASAGTYTVCAVYIDLANTSCVDSSCVPVTVTAVGVIEPVANTMNVSAVPNPFATDINVTVSITQSQDVQVVVYDITGKQVSVLQDGNLNAGTHIINWKPETLSEGVYFVQVKAGDLITTKKIVYTSHN